MKPRPALSAIALASALEVASLGLVGCSLPLGETFDEPGPRPLPPLETLVAGDTLEVEFARATAQRGDYRLGLGDRVRVEVQLHPELAATLVVAPDGTVAYQRIGSLPVAGRTLEGARATLQEALARQLPEPAVSLFLEQGDVELDRALELLLRHPTGSLREPRIDGDGRLSLPLLGSVLVAGLTVREVEELLNARLAALQPNLQVSVRAKELTRRHFTVVGEVYRPGRLPLDRELTLIDAIALAGGDTPVADLEAVLVVGAPRGDLVEATLYDVETALEHGSTLAQVQVHPQDTIVVRRTAIGDVNEWVDQWLRRNIPVNMSFTYRLDDPNN